MKIMPAFASTLFNYYLRLLFTVSCVNLYVYGHLLHRWHGGFLGDPNKYSTLQREYEQKDEWFDQPLDHFAPLNSIKWKQRYFVNDDYYIMDNNNTVNDQVSPVFLLIGGESEAAKKWMHKGSWIHYAEHFSALCFYLEHRFYGKSTPTSNLSTTNLRYLTSEQALEDLRAFVKGMKVKYNLNSKQKWIVFGGSYPGNLAAWAREKYPDLIYGAISSSAPLLAKLDFKEYYEVVENSLRNYSYECVVAVGKGFHQIEILLKHPIGQRSLDDKFRTCTAITDSIDNELDLSNFFEAIASNFAGIVQYNNDNSPRATITIDDVCKVMVNVTNGPPVNRLAKVNELILQEQKQKCLDFKYDKMINTMQNINWSSESANGSRQWTWQTCNEFGYYQTSEQSTQTFGERFKVNFFIQQCIDIYGPNMNINYLNEMIDKTNFYYGGLNPKTTNVLYVHGSIDPWHALGLIKSKDLNRPTIYIEGGAHCSDMYEPSKKDSAQLIAARNGITKYLAKLLSDN